MDFHKVLSDPLFSVGSTKAPVGQALAVVATLIITFLLARAARQLSSRSCWRGRRDNLPSAISSDTM
jgi:hypothetical protein